jgi:predicted transcriptional regulator
MVPARRDKHKTPRRMAAQDPSVRRSGAELSELRDKLCERVHARPGETMVVLADDLGVPVRALYRAMAKLKLEGRVRSAGRRNMMRYFPAVARASTKSS